MQATLAAVFPVFALLMLGNLARRSDFLDTSFWAQAEKGTYYVLFPALLVSSLSQADFNWQQEIQLILAAILLPLCAAALCYLLQNLLQLAQADFTSFFQGGIRFNTYIGLALVATLPGDGLPLAALILAIMIPLVNVLCVLTYELYSDAAGVSWRKVLLGIIQNPLVVACLLGIGLNLTGLLPPVLVADILEKLSAMALPMGLLAVGAGLRLQALRGASHAFLWSAALKLALLPAVALGLGYSVGLEPLAVMVFVIFAALPTASSAYILARQMGGNAELMAAMITGQTLLALLSLPLLLLALEQFQH